jgi:hypothetical protein
MENYYFSYVVSELTPEQAEALNDVFVRVVEAFGAETAGHVYREKSEVDTDGVEDGEKS